MKKSGKPMLKVIMTFALAVAMVMGALPLEGLVIVAKAVDGVSYREASWDESTNTVSYTTQTVNGVTEVVSKPSESVTWNAGWYVVNTDATIAERITVNGDVKLILADGVTLTASKGITVPADKSLTIYGQTNGTGKLVASHPHVEGGKAAIGKDSEFNPCGNITIHGGQIQTNDESVFSYDYADIAGIGGSSRYEGAKSVITIYGGTVTTYSKGGGGIVSDGAVNIYGGTVTAIEEGNAAAIGGPNVDSCVCGTISITGGTIIAENRVNGSGIGTGQFGQGGTISITGGTITATGRSASGAAIGSGYSYDSYVDSITISGGTITAYEYKDNGTPYGIGVIGDGTGTGKIGDGTVRGRTKPVKVQISGDTSLSCKVKDMIVAAGKTVTVPAAGTLDVTGTVTDNGTVIVTGTVTENGTVINRGTMTVKDTGRVTVANGAMLKVGANGLLTNNGSIEVESGGSATVEATGSLTNNGSIEVKSGGSATVEDGGVSRGDNPTGDGDIRGFKPTLKITANDNSITYGETPEAAGVSCYGFNDSDTVSDLSGTLNYSFSYSQYGDVGNNYTITPSGLSSEKYNIVYVPGTMTVEPKEVALTWDDTPLYFKGEAQAPGAVATGLNGDVINVTVGGAQTDAGTGYTATATGLTGSKAGNYKLPSTGVEKSFSIKKDAARTLSDKKVSLVYTATSFTASVADVMPENAGALSFTAGTATKTGNVNISDFSVDKDGKVSLTVSDGEAGDTFTLPVTVTSTNYEDSTVNVVVTLKVKNTQTVSFAESAVKKTYGDEDFTVVAIRDKGDGAVTYAVSEGADVATVDATTGTVHILKAGSATIRATAAETEEYALATAQYTLTVDRKAVTVKADDKSIQAGEAVPELTATVTGLVRGDAETVISYIIEREEGTAVGTYTITPAGETTQGNYIVSFETGKLTIKEKKAKADNRNTGSGTGSYVVGSGSGGTGAITNVDSKTDANKTTAPVTEKKTNADGSVTETTKTTSADGSKTETEKTTSADGTVKETEKTTSVDGTVKETEKTSDVSGTVTEKTSVTEKDGSATVSEKVTEKDGSSVETTVTVGSDGKAKTITATENNSKSDTQTVSFEVKGNKVSVSAVESTTGIATIPSEITAPNGKTYKVTKIDKNVFDGQKIKELNLSDSVKVIAPKALAGTDLKKLNLTGENTKLKKNCLKDTNKNLVITVTTKAEKKKLEKQLKKAGNPTAKVKVSKKKA